MRNTAFYQKYRPLVFDDLLNQNTIVDFLSKAINKKSINHFYILSGNKGTGKTTTARIFAKSINCDLEEISPCYKCNSCLDETLTIEIDASSNNGVDNIRMLIEKSKQVSVGNKYKVFILDEAHMLSKSAFNAMLKTLEETGKDNVFILATTEINKIPDTIISRAINLYFNDISKDHIINLIKNVANSEKINIDEESVKLICDSSNNAARNALINLQKASIYSDNNISINRIQELFKVLSDENKNIIYNDISNGTYSEKSIDIIHKINPTPTYLYESMIDISINRKDDELTNYLVNIYGIYLENKNSIISIPLLFNYKKRNNNNNAIIKPYDKNDLTRISVISNNEERISKDVTIHINDILDKATIQDRKLWNNRWDQNKFLIKEKRFISIILPILDSSIVAASKDGIVIVSDDDFSKTKLTKYIDDVSALANYYSGENIACIVYTKNEWNIQRNKYLDNKKNKKISVTELFGTDIVEEI